MKSVHADRHSCASTARSALDAEAITVLLDLLNFTHDIPGASWWQRKIGTTRSISALLTLDLIVKLIQEAGLSVSRGIQSVFFFKLAADILMQFGFQGKRSELQRHIGCSVGPNTGENALDAFRNVGLFHSSVWLVVEYGEEAVRIREASVHELDIAVLGEKCNDRVSTIVELFGHVTQHQIVDLTRHWNVVLLALV